MTTYPKPKHKSPAHKAWRSPNAKAYMSEHSDCEACRLTWATECHHIVSRRYDGTDVERNFLALCASCHREYHESFWRFTAIYPHLTDKINAARIEHNRKEITHD